MDRARLTRNEFRRVIQETVQLAIRDSRSAEATARSGTWDRNIEILGAIKEQYGDCAVPAGSRLYTWIEGQRKKWQTGKLDYAQIKALQGLGIERNRPLSKIHSFNLSYAGRQEVQIAELNLVKGLLQQGPRSKLLTDQEAELTKQLEFARDNGLMPSRTSKRFDDIRHG